LPKINDLFASLSGGQTFTKLDLASAYLQIPLDEATQKVLTINTHKGLYKYKRLPFGVSATPGIFQRTLEIILQGLPGVCVYLNDLMLGKSNEEHLINLSAMLRRLATAGMRLKSEKCSFLLQEVEYLGHKISAKGYHREGASHSSSTTACKCDPFLGMLNYFGKFLPNLSTCLAPLYKLLQKQSRWNWGRKRLRRQKIYLSHQEC